MDAIPPKFPAVSPSLSSKGSLALSPDTILRWMMRLIGCNPFYLISAALLLFGIYRLSIDPKFLSGEMPRLIFNFYALQAYGVLLVLTAILLARRCVWYDATLLVFLEAKFVLLPFILLSLAAWDSEGTARALCVIGSYFAAARWIALKRYYPQLNLSSRLMFLGLIVLLTNVALPLFFKHQHEAQPGSVAPFAFAGWMGLLPLLMALANFLPRPQRRGELIPERSWLPLALYATWIAVTCVHLWSLAYIHDVARSAALLAPVVWVAAWTVVKRREDILGDRAERWLAVAWCLPVLATFHTSIAIFFALSALNAACFIAMASHEQNRVAFQLALLSLTGALASVPEGLVQVIWVDYSRGKWILMASGAYLLLQTILRRNLNLAVVSSIGIAVATPMLFRHVAGIGQFALQNGFVFFLMHSLWWEDTRHPLARQLRISAAVGWVCVSAYWICNAAVSDAWPMSCYAGALLLGYGVARWWRGEWEPIILPIAAAVVIVLVPARVGFDTGRRAPLGVVAMLASMLLFAIGTVLAWTKHRWLAAKVSAPSPKP